MIQNYLLLAYRNLIKKKWFTLINISGLAIGMAIAILILNYVSFEYSYDQMHTNAERIYRVESQFYDGNVMSDDWPTASFGYAPAMKKHIPGIENYVRIDLNQRTQVVRYGNKKFRETKVVATEPSFFDIFTIPLVEGDVKTALEGPNKVVITQTAAKRYFGNDDPIGKILTLSSPNSTTKCAVTGIIESLPKNMHIDFDFFISWKSLPNWKNTTWYCHESYSYILLAPNVNPKKIEAQFPQMAETYKTGNALREKKWAITLNPLSDIHLTPQKQYEIETKGNQKAINTLIIVAIAILLIAWINYINLTTARSLERAREVGVRKVSGAFKKQLIFQFLLESFMVNLIAFAIAITIVVITFPLFSQLIGKEVTFVLMKQPLFWQSLLLFFTVGIFLSGFYPAFVLSSVKPVSILKGKFVHSASAGNVRKGLVVVQFAASLVLICGSIVVYAQLSYMQSQPLGVNIDQTLTIGLPAYSSNVYKNRAAFMEELHQMPGVSGETITNGVPGMEIATFCSNYRADDPAKQNKLYEMLTVTPNYLTTFDIEMITGRFFARDNKADVNRLVVNEAAVKQLGITSNEKAIGKKVFLEGQSVPVEIIGVVKDYHQRGLNNAYTPIMMILHAKMGWIPLKYFAMRIAGDNVHATVEKIKERWAHYFPNSSFDHFFVDQFYNQQYSQDRRFGYVFGLFALLATLIACLGLWALALFTSLFRTKEMGVRKVLGATTSNLFVNLSKGFIFLIGFAVTVGIPAAYLIMKNWLSNYAFKTNLQWWFFAIPVVMVISIALITISWQTLKTARNNPTDSLCYE
ncbi:ABC transporter permease [Prolixibacteraceae bacterium JC049]|nr:ABC transporter permease [Prolixibacteraceae bacterium JC049]